MEAIEFCQCRGISRSTLYRHLSKRTQSQAKAGNRFLAVELRAASGSTSGNGGGLLVALSNGRKIEVSRGFDAATLERLLTVLDKV